LSSARKTEGIKSSGGFGCENREIHEQGECVEEKCLKVD
jgi:hypothetical protein